MAVLIDDLLSLSRVARSEMQKETLNLSAVARSVTAELQKEESDRQVEFIIEENLFVNGDLRLLRIVIENLLSNAWKYTARHSRAGSNSADPNREGGQYISYATTELVLIRSMRAACLELFSGSFQFRVPGYRSWPRHSATNHPSTRRGDLGRSSYR